MALIKCPECQENVSTMASVCPHCGFPIKEFVQQQSAKQDDEKLKKLFEENKSLQNVKRGKVFFGSYFQSTENLKEPIQWHVLKIRGHYALLLSEKCLDFMPYNDVRSASWGVSTIRKWLNNGFLKNAFTDVESLLICDISEIQDNLDEYYISDCIEMDDRIFLPSAEDVSEYSIHAVAPTAYAIAKCSEPGKLYTSGEARCWLRSSEDCDSYAQTADYREANYVGENVKAGYIGVRPCLWVKIPDIS